MVLIGCFHEEFEHIAICMELGNDSVIKYLNKIDDKLEEIKTTFERELERNNVLLERIVKLLNSK